MTSATDAETEAYLAAISGLIPATAQQVGAALGKLSRKLEELTGLLMVADKKATELTEQYQLEYDKAFLAARVDANPVSGKAPTEADCHAKARMATTELRMQAEVAKLDVRNLKAQHRTLDRRIDVGRTQAATVRSEHNTFNYGRGA